MIDIWPAPAKLNLFLHVVGRRPDGYHLLQTVFQFLDVSDELRFRVLDDGRILRASPLPGVRDEDDLCVRAAHALKSAAGTAAGVEITLSKRIPLGGGLGGGSSDAATVLLALNRLWRLDWPLARLAELGLTLGADVPVFIHGRAAWAEGVGERLQPLDLAQPWYVVLAPPVHVPTGRVFAQLRAATINQESAPDRTQALQLTHLRAPITIRDFLEGRASNDLEPIVRELYPQVDAALQWLGGFGAARMTGSGACIFLQVASKDEGEAILAQRPRGCTGFVARGRNVHPVHVLLGY